MGNSLDIYADAGETAGEPAPQPIRQTADRPHDRSLNTAEELAGADPSKVEIPTTATRAVNPSVETVEMSSNRQPQPHPVCRSPDRSVTEDNPRSDRTATANDSVTRGRRCGVTSGRSRSERKVTSQKRKGAWPRSRDPHNFWRTP